MGPVEKCFFCERSSPEADLVAWFVEDERRATHTACWIEAHHRSLDRVRKTLEDIRRELDAAYPTESEAAATPVAVLVDEDARAVEHHRASSRRRRSRRHFVAVLGGIAGSVLLVVVTRGMMPRGAVASAPDMPSAAMPIADELRGVDRRDAQPSAAVVPLAVLTELDRQVKALRSDVQALAARLEGSDSRVAGMESRVRDMESSVRRIAEDVTSSAAIRAADRPAAAPRQTASRPVPVAPGPPAPAPVTVAHPERWMPLKHPANANSSASEIQPVADAVAAPEPRTAAATPGVRSTHAGSAVSDNASRPSAPPSFAEKLRADWRAIRQGFATAGDELKATMRDATGKITRE
jgi:hypothetical protein